MDHGIFFSLLFLFEFLLYDGSLDIFMGLDGYRWPYQKSPTSSREWLHSATQLIDIPFHRIELGLSSLRNVRHQRICQSHERRPHTESRYRICCYKKPISPNIENHTGHLNSPGQLHCDGVRILHEHNFAFHILSTRAGFLQQPFVS